MPKKNNQNLLQAYRRGFTMIEITAAVLILSILLSSVLLLINRYLEAVVDMRLHRHAFEVARANMETLLSEDELSDMSDSGQSEEYPDIDWETVIEPFTEPVKERMWVRAVCSASYTDSQNEIQEVELEHWITSLTAAQIKQILNQKEVMGEYYDLIKEGFMSAVQMATMAFLEVQGLAVDVYRDLVEEHRMQKLEYLQANSGNFNEKKFDDFAEELQEEEDELLEELGMDFKAYNVFALTYKPPASANDSDIFGPDDSVDVDDTDTQDIEDSEDSEDSYEEEHQWDWDNIPRELWGLVEKLTGAKPPY